VLHNTYHSHVKVGFFLDH